ncbi:recombinase family protein [Niameybacter massiliensis]|uniref:Recombinase family protein n=1 Tax=Holtiella tumoricola TaxID=3018743 RepID=A0AA42DPE4_9FIRM|nr:recombinase family protein [Holtiella tumoricola]MDA3732343.1 recombinase family protein [Holtiella tumoricola]
MTAALYIRVSTDDQLEFSPDAQKRALLEYAKKNNILVDEQYIFVDEGISGTSAKKRPAFQTMIATAKKKPKPFDTILVHKFDRFARSREDSVVYKSLLRKECDIKVISITEQMEDDKFSVILEAMLEAMAEYYSLNLSDEVMKGMTEKARRGLPQSEAPYGYRRDGDKYVLVDDEAEIVKMIFSKFNSGELGYGEICRFLLLNGITNRKGQSFTVSGIKYMLENPIYCGKVRWNYSTHKGGRRKNPKEKWIITDGEHQRIISDELYESVQQKINSLKKAPGHYTPNKEIKHWLSGLLRCSNCKKVLVYNKGYHKYPFYRCNGYNKGVCTTSNMGPLHFYEKEVLKALSLKFNELSQGLGNIDSVVVKTNKETSNKILLQKQLEKVRRKYEIAKKAYLAEIDTLEEYANNKSDIEKEERDLLDKLSKEISSEDVSKIITSKLEHAIQILNDDSKSNTEKNTFLKSFINSIDVDRNNDLLKINMYVEC